jgi:adenosylhomocysteine nucleosidase
MMNAKYREWIFRVWQARCLDMESTAYAQVCWANEKPLLVIRALSDLAGGEPGKNTLSGGVSAEVCANGAKVLHAVLNELPK